MNERTTSRACVFIDSSNPSMPSTVINGAQPFLKPPFPPSIKPRDLLRKSRDGSMSKPPNAFIIYRKWYIETARSQGYFLPMTVISSMASQSWEQESVHVKAEYKRLGREAFNLRNDMLPKTARRRKREKWNIVKFDEEVVVKVEPKATSQSLNKNDQYPLSPPESLSTETTPEVSPLVSPIMSPSSLSSPSYPSSDKESALPSPIRSPPMSPDSSNKFSIPSPIRPNFGAFTDGTNGVTEPNNWFSSPSPDISDNNEQYFLFEQSIIIDLILEQQSQRQQSSSYLDGINTDNSLYGFSSFNISSQEDFLPTESSGNFYYI